MPTFQLEPAAIPLLLRLAQPGEREQVLREVAAQSGASEKDLAALFDVLVGAGIVRESTNRTTQAAGVSHVFDRLVYHRGMLRDQARMRAFRTAIEKVVRPGDVVIDVGSGSGVLSLLAARAGASKVYGLEATSLVNDARLLAEANGLADRVSFVKADAATFSSENPVDLVMGEWASLLLVDEWRHFDAFARVRERCLRTGGTVLPRRARLSIVPVSDTALWDEFGLGFWERPLEGFDYTLGRTRQLEAPRRFTVRASAASFLSDPIRLLDMDCATADADAYVAEVRVEVELKSTALCHGFVGYFDLELAPDVWLDTSPLSPQTHWQQSYLPMPQFAVQPGDVLRAVARLGRTQSAGRPTLAIDGELLRKGVRVHRLEHEFQIGDAIA